MKIISVFNNKGGVGKTTLTYHLAHILAEMDKKVLILDMDSQCNMTLYGMQEETLEKIWRDEDYVIDNGFESAKQQMKEDDFNNLFKTTRTMHFLLKSVEEGISDFEELPPPINLANNLDLIPSRLTLFQYENKIAERWTGIFLGEPLPIRTVTRIRKLAELYSEKNHYDFVIIDTSPSLGILNKVIISTVDGFMIPCLPDMFSLYGIKNIGEVLTKWQRDFSICLQFISKEKCKAFPKKPVRFLGYTIYNAKKGENQKYNWLTKAHFDYVQQIPDTIKKHIAERVREHLSEEMVRTSIGNDAIMHSHNTLTNMAQKYKAPI
ncbi:AAA family ATPase [Candidatus Parabeggiatoa sp. HSG14]|uniref:ParA family protein n=1 Tax=Candidatus Parabeggiatoa sp. HSG14 TaxID=3055593 RepID=UPI0025A69A64|nr:AAA family ATPase [Thiotrichales bacterium HSG14]